MLGGSPHTYNGKTRHEPRVRKQYYFRPSQQGLLAWDVDRLVELSRHLPRRYIPLTAIRELDEPWAGDGEPLSWRKLIEHLKLIEEADLSFPIILSQTGTSWMVGIAWPRPRGRSAPRSRRSSLSGIRNQIRSVGNRRSCPIEAAA
jgi:hypothetical protein